MQASMMRHVLAGWLDKSALMGGMRQAAVRSMQAQRSAKVLLHSFLAWHHNCKTLQVARAAAGARGHQRELAMLQGMLQAWQHAATSAAHLHLGKASAEIPGGLAEASAGISAQVLAGAAQRAAGRTS